MALSKKQKKQVEAARKKITSLEQQLAGARGQPDDPKEAPRLEAEIEKLRAEIRAINESK